VDGHGGDVRVRHRHEYETRTAVRANPLDGGKRSTRRSIRRPWISVPWQTPH
jgi:hypothetical protein